MNTILPRPPIPADFDEQVYARIWLSQLPLATAANDFDTPVLSGATSSRLWLLNCILVAMAIALGLWLASRPHIVTVSYVPDVRSAHTDLTNLPPISISQDMRWNSLTSTTKRAKKLVGRAGY